MAFASRINRLFDVKSGSSRRAAPARRRRAALHLESLEERVMLSTTYVVNTENDVQLATLQPGSGWDTNNNGEVSLRSAIEAVNYEAANNPSAGPFTIDVPEGTYDLTLGELDLIPNGMAVTIAGAGAKPVATVISAQFQSRVLEIQAGTLEGAGAVALENLTLEGGEAQNSGAIGSAEAVGGAILDSGNALTLQNMTVSDNEVLASSSFPNAAGGAIYALGAPLTIANSTIQSNTITVSFGAFADGGGIDEDGANLTLTNSTIEENTIEGGSINDGAGIAASNSNVSVSGSSITSNYAAAGAGSNNVAGGSAAGGGLYFYDGSIEAGHSLTVTGSQIDDNRIIGGAGGNGYGTTGGIRLYGQAYGPGLPGQAGGSVSGGGIAVNSNTGTTSVSISSSTVDGNNATSGAGGAAAASGVGPQLGGIETLSAAGSPGGAAGTVTGVGIDVNAPSGNVQISGSSLSNNTGTGGAGGAGGAGGRPGANGLGMFSANPAPGGAGGQGGTVQGVGATITSANLSVADTTIIGNMGNGGDGGDGGASGVSPSGEGAGGSAGGTGGSGGNVFGSSLYVPNAGDSNVSLSMDSVLNNLSTGGAGGPGGSGSNGTSVDIGQQSTIFGYLSDIPVIGVLGNLGSIVVDIARVDSTYTGGAGGDGGVGGLGGTVSGALVLFGNAEVNATAIVGNSGLGGMGGSGGNGGNGGNSDDSGAGGTAGNAGAGGMGGFVYGGGLETIGGTVTVADTTIDSNVVAAGMGGGFGLPGAPGSEQSVQLSDFFYPALNVLVALVPGDVGSELGYQWSITKVELSAAEYLATGTYALPQFLALTPSVTGDTGQEASAAISGVTGGGGIYVEGGTVNLINDTITSNTSDIAGGVYVTGGATLNIGNTVVAQNTARVAEPDLYAETPTNLNSTASPTNTLISLGHNFIGAIGSNASSFNQPGDITGTLGAPLNPDLGPLQTNGTTLNREPMVDSLLLGGGSMALATQFGLTSDQTGSAWFIDGTVAIGADEGLPGLFGATLTVNSTDGTEDPTNVLTLEEAVALTNGTLTYNQLTPQQQAQVNLGTGSGPDTIQFASSLAGQTISLSTAQASFFGPTALAIDVPVTIIGPGGGLTISGSSSAGSLRLFDVALTGQLTLENLTLSQGLAVGAAGATGSKGGGGGGGGAGMGGAILNFGALTIQNSTLSGNSAQGGAGGPNGAPLAGQYLYEQTGGPGGGQAPGLAEQAAGFGSGGGGASFAGYGGAGGLGGGGGGNANKELDVPGYTSQGAGGLGGGGTAGGVGRVGGGGGAGMGGAIFNTGTVTITGSTLTGNTTAGGLGADNGGNGIGLGGAVFNDDGTVTITNSTFTANVASQGAGIANVGTGQSAPFPLQAATVTLTNSTLADSSSGAPDYKAIAINGGTTSNLGGNDLIQGIPSGGSPEGTPIALTAAFTDTGSATPATDLNDLWQVSNSAGQTVVAAQDLRFNPTPGPVVLPVSLIQNSGTITVDVTFQTTSGGVILGYQDQPLGTAPGNFVPALYVGTNGRLYAEISTGTTPGSVQPIESMVTVNDGREHQAVLTVATSPIGGVTETLTLDGVTVGILDGTLQPLNMAFDQIGTGDTANWPGGNGGFDPFNGTIAQINITDNSGANYSAQQLSFTPTSPVTLPSGLIGTATTLTVDVSFQTTSGGVILGYQNQPAGSTPTQAVPVLYVGTNGLLYAEPLDGSARQLISTEKVNDGLVHQAILNETASGESLYLDGTLVGTLSGTPNSLGLTYNLIGTGYTTGATAAPDGYDPFVGTIDQVQISNSSALANSVVFPTSSNTQISFTPPLDGTDAISLQASGATGDLETASQDLSISGMAPTPAISGLPGTSPGGAPISLTASATDPSAANMAAGFNYVWQATTSSGQMLLASQALSFTGVNPISLPNALIAGARPLTVNLAFQTTAGGVILGAQNQPDGTTPTQSIPILYVGTDGYLYASALSGSSGQLISTEKVNDGQVHQVVLTFSGGTESLTLDGTSVGTLSGLSTPPSLTFDQLGTGYTTGGSATPGGYDPFVGTIDAVQISTGTALAGSWTFPGAGDTQAAFLPPDYGSYTIGLSATDQQGLTGSTSQNLIVTPETPAPSISGLPATGPWGSPIALTATQLGADATAAAGLNNIWSVSTAPGQEVVAGQDLAFNGYDPISLPSGLIAGAATLTLDVTFQTNSDGVILGYQNQPTSTTPSQYMPALYVGTDGLLYAEIFDGSFREMVSSTKVDDGKVHTAVLVETGSAQSLTLDGTLIATLSGTPNPLSMTDDQLGTGYTLGHPNTPGGYFPFTGTIDSLTITSGTALAGSVALTGSSGNQITFTPPTVGTYTVGLSTTNTGDLSGSTSQTYIASDVAPTPAIGGLPASSPEGTPVTLTAAATDPVAADTAAGFDYVWSVMGAAGSGNGVVLGQGLNLQGNSSVALPNGLIVNASTFTVSVTFQTTGDGVILGYQNQPTSTTPTQYMPALYVGTNGLLYAEVFDGSFREMSSTTEVNNGKPHTAELIETGSSQLLYLDGSLLGDLLGDPDPLNMTYDQIGTGYTLGHPDTPGGYFPFVGTISSVSITTQGAPALDGSLAGSVTLTGSTGSQVTFTPPDTGLYTIELAATDVAGLTGYQTATFSPTDITPTITIPTTAVATQGATFTLNGSFTDAPGDGPWYVDVNYGDNTATQYAIGLSANSQGVDDDFTLSHVYANAGLFNAQVTLINGDDQIVHATVQVTVTGFTVNDGSPQQSMVTSLTYTFNDPTQVEPGAFELLRNGKPSEIHLSIAPKPDGMTYVITFSGPGVVGGSVPDGNYTLITLANKVNVLSGPPMTANDVNTFTRLFGDVEGLGVVNAADKALLKQAEADPSSPDAAYFEYDGKPGIDKTDIAQFNKRYKGKTDPPKKAPAKFPGRKVQHQVAAHIASAPVRAAVSSPVKAVDRLRTSGILPQPLHHARHGRES